MIAFHCASTVFNARARHSSSYLILIIIVIIMIIMIIMIIIIIVIIITIIIIIVVAIETILCRIQWQRGDWLLIRVNHQHPLCAIWQHESFESKRQPLPEIWAHVNRERKREREREAGRILKAFGQIILSSAMI